MTDQVKTDRKQTDHGRRDFLKLAAVAAPAAAVTATVAPDTAKAQLTADAGEGLRKTPHVEAYLNSARF